MKNFKKILLGLSFLMVISLSCIGQSPYELSLKKELSFFGAGVLGQVGTLVFSKKIDAFTEEELGLLNSNSINRFDRRAVGFYSLRMQGYSDVLKTSAYVYPLLFLTDKKGRKGFLEIGVLSAESFLLNASITSLVKISAQRTRPLAYNPDVPLDKRKSKSSKFSFYSGHTSAASVLSFFSAKVFSDYYPDSKWKPVVWSAAAVIPAATGYFRVKGGKHFPTDVIVGYLAGALIGVGIPHLHRKKDKNEKMSFSILSSSNSLGLTMTF